MVFFFLSFPFTSCFCSYLFASFSFSISSLCARIGPRQFLALTNQGAYLLVKRRPLDELYELLLSSGGQATPALTEFFATYGDEQVCCVVCF